MNRLTVLTLILTSSMAAYDAQAAGDPAAGQAIATKTCQACHGSDGNSTNPQYPRLAGQHADYLARALHDYKQGTRKNPIMAGFAAALSDEDIDDVAAWFASQTGLASPEAPRTVQH